MATTKKITVSTTIASIVAKVVKHLSVIGKRAKDVNGNSLFSDITITESEKSILNDLVNAGAETIVNQLAPFCGAYGDTENASIKFTITAKNWAVEDTDNNKDLTKALAEAIDNYLYNYTLAQYLSIVRPSTGEKYPPLYGSTYTNHCALIIQNIIGLCNLNRVPMPSTKTYADVKRIANTAVLKITPMKASLPEPLPINGDVYINGVKCTSKQKEVETNTKVYYTIIPESSSYAEYYGECIITEDTELKPQLHLKATT